MNKTIWIINEYAGSKYHGMEFRHYYLGKELVKRGYKVYIITASYSHLFKKLPEEKGVFTFEHIDGIHYIWIRVPRYGHAHNKRRVLKWLALTLRLYKLPVHKMKEPHALILSPMAPFPILPAYKLAKRFNAKLIYEVKDIWPLTLIELGGYSKLHPLIALMQWCEDSAYRKADYVVSVLPRAIDHMKQHGLKPERFVYIPNGICLEEISAVQPLDAQTGNKIPKDKFVVGYAGTIGFANALEYLVDAAELLKEHKDIVFVIVGEGMEKEKLTNSVERKGLKNVTFIDAVPKNQVQNVLKKFEVCYIGWRKSSLYKYGISANKIFDYAYAAKPIVHSYSGSGDIINEANCGISVEYENSKTIADAIMKLYDMSPEERKQLGENGKKYVLENHSYESLADKYEMIVNGN